jgi:hypothetical protein
MNKRFIDELISPNLGLAFVAGTTIWIGGPDHEIKQFDNAIIDEKRTHELRATSTLHKKIFTVPLGLGSAGTITSHWRRSGSALAEPSQKERALTIVCRRFQAPVWSDCCR